MNVSSLKIACLPSITCDFDLVGPDATAGVRARKDRALVRVYYTRTPKTPVLWTGLVTAVRPSERCCFLSRDTHGKRRRWPANG